MLQTRSPVPRHVQGPGRAARLGLLQLQRLGHRLLRVRRRQLGQRVRPLLPGLVRGHAGAPRGRDASRGGGGAAWAQAASAGGRREAGAAPAGVQHPGAHLWNQNYLGAYSVRMSRTAEREPCGWREAGTAPLGVHDPGAPLVAGLVSLSWGHPQCIRASRPAWKRCAATCAAVHLESGVSYLKKASALHKITHSRALQAAVANFSLLDAPRSFLMPERFQLLWTRCSPCALIHNRTASYWPDQNADSLSSTSSCSMFGPAGCMRLPRFEELTVLPGSTMCRPSL